MSSTNVNDAALLRSHITPPSDKPQKLRHRKPNSQNCSVIKMVPKANSTVFTSSVEETSLSIEPHLNLAKSVVIENDGSKDINGTKSLSFQSDGDSFLPEDNNNKEYLNKSDNSNGTNSEYLNCGYFSDENKSNTLYSATIKGYNSPSLASDDDSMNVTSDNTILLPKMKGLSRSKTSDASFDTFSSRQSSDHIITDGNKDMESMFTIALQMLFPFIMAGFGMVAAGIVLDKVQHWDVFENVPEIFILVPALLGLKGNLEMTLASRLSTNANRGLLDDTATRNKIVLGNIVLVEGQAMVISFLASLVAMILGWIPDGTWETNHAILLCTGSLLTGAIASFLLGMIMIIVIILSRKIGVNPDNIATPIAASLGDLVTILLLSTIVNGMYKILYNPATTWIGPTIIAIFCVLTPLFLWLAHRNNFTRDVVKHGWVPVIAAMAISSAGGFILDFAVSINKGIAVFSPVINGVGGNLVAVQASRISTMLHSSAERLGQLPAAERAGCVSPCFLACAPDNSHAVGARVMLMLVVPGQLLFLLTINLFKAGHTTISIQFVLVYILVSVFQVWILLQVCHWLVMRLWRKGIDPDNSAIPYLTALGDLLGTALLSLAFAFLWAVGDRDSDVGD